MEILLQKIRNSTGVGVPLISMGVMLFFLFLISLSIGAVPISIPEIFSAFSAKMGFSSLTNHTQQLVLLNIRLPRLFFTVLIGAALGLSGAALQGLFRNPLVEPGIIGVSSGAALGTIMVIMFLGSWVSAHLPNATYWILPVFSFMGGLIATVATLQISRYEGKTLVTYLILSGVAISALAAAMIGLSIFYANEAQLRTYTFWTLGDLSVATWEKMQILFPVTLFSIIALTSLARPLNALALGEAEAFHSGVSVERIKLLVIVFSALAVGTSVAFSGIIGFVGLVVPHIIRICFSSDHRMVLPGSAIGGSILLLGADIFARTVVAPAELPIGVVTALIGTPFFIYLIISSKKKQLH